MPDEPLIDGKPIPEIVKELRQIRRSLKGNARVKMSNSIDHLIKAYAATLIPVLQIFIGYLHTSLRLS